MRFLDLFESKISRREVIEEDAIFLTNINTIKFLKIAMPSLENMRGTVIPLPTVFDKDHEVDKEMMGRLTNFYVDAGVPGLFVNGSTGQFPVLSLEERKTVAEIAVSESKDKLPTIIHVGSADPYSSIKLALHAKSIGADAIGLIAPHYYNDRTEFEILEYFRLVYEAVRMPILLYDIPRFVGFSLTPEFAVKIRNVAPSIFAAKLDAGNTDDAIKYQKALGQNFAVYVHAPVIFGLLWGASKGAVSPLACMVPEAGVALVRLFDSKRILEALSLQERIERFNIAVSSFSRKYSIRSVLRTGLQIRGFDVNYPRWPSQNLSPEDAAVIRSEIEKLNNFIQTFAAPKVLLANA